MNPDTPFHYVYVLLNEDGKFYTGCTKDLRKRVKEHNDGKSTFTKNRGKYELIYYEACRNKSDSYRRERYLKSGMGKKYIRGRTKLFLEGVSG